MQKFTEGSIEWYRAILNQIINDDMTVCQNQKDCLDLLLNMNIDLPFKDNPDAQQMGIKVSQYAHKSQKGKLLLLGVEILTIFTGNICCWKHRTIK